MTNQMIAQLMVLGMFCVLFTITLCTTFKSVWERFGYSWGLYDLEVEYEDEKIKKINKKSA